MPNAFIAGSDPGEALLKIHAALVSANQRGGASTLTEQFRRLLSSYQDLRREVEECLIRVWEAPEALHQATG